MPGSGRVRAQKRRVVAQSPARLADGSPPGSRRGADPLLGASERATLNGINMTEAAVLYREIIREAGLAVHVARRAGRRRVSAVGRPSPPLSESDGSVYFPYVVADNLSGNLTC